MRLLCSFWEGDANEVERREDARVTEATNDEELEGTNGRGEACASVGLPNHQGALVEDRGR